MDFGNWMIEAAYNDGRIGGAELPVVLVIAAHADYQTAECFLGVETIAKYTRKTPRTIFDLIDKLQINGVLQYVRGNGRGCVSRFKLLLKKVEVSAQRRKKVPPFDGQEKAELFAKKVEVSDTVKDNHLKKHSLNTKRGTRLPDQFLLTAEMRAWAKDERPDVDVNTETKKFCNHFRSQPGQKGVKLDWVLTWENWILNARGTYGTPYSKPKRSPGETVIARHYKRDPA